MRRWLLCFAVCCAVVSAAAQYVPSADNLAARRDFEECRFGIFIHWGIYSSFAQGEWYLNSGLTHDEYSKAASAFYPIHFDARAWALAIRSSGARYVTFTSRHHDGFSMFRSQASPYNIVEATPFRRDVVGELAEACRREGLRFHLYYSLLDWMRPDYPLGRTGHHTRTTLHPDYASYYRFMQQQISELLRNYPYVGGIWLDGYWDHDADSVPFDWKMKDFYRYIHALKPACLIGNNHHISPIEGEDFQMFERDLPGENTAGLSGQEVSQLPLEMCQTMNGMWGYKVSDQQYKSTGELIQLIARAASKNSNLLLNIGPQPNGELPTAALERLYGIGEWMRENSPSIYATHSTTYGEQPWGVTTQKANVLYLHVFDASATRIRLPWLGRQPRHVRSLETKHSLPYSTDRQARLLTINLPSDRNTPDYVVEIEN